MTRRCCLALAAAAIPATARRTPARTPQPARRQVLENGITVFLAEDHELPVVRGLVVLRGGLLMDAPDFPGLSAIAAPLLRSGGAGHLSAESFDERLEDLGASLDVQAEETAIQASFGGFRRDAKELLGLLRLALTEPRFDPVRIDRARAEARLAILRRNEDPSAVAARELTNLLYGQDTAFGRETGEFHIESLDAARLRNWAARFCAPSSTLLALYGDFEPAAMLEAVRSEFGAWRAPARARPELPRPAPASPSGLYIAPRPGLEETFFHLGQLGGLATDPDCPALDVLCDILGGGFRSRLFDRLRTRLGYAYSVSAAWSSQLEYPGMFEVSGSTEAGNTARTLAVVFEEIERLRAEPVTARELNAAKRSLEQSAVFLADTPAKLLARRLEEENARVPPGRGDRYRTALRRVTPADVQRAARERLRPAEMTIVVAGDPARFRDAIAPLGRPVREIRLSNPEAPASRR